MTEMLNKEEAKESIDSYLGEKEKEVLKTLTPSTLKLFMKKQVKPGISYYVRGSKKLLEQFKAYYLAICMKEENRPKYSVQMLTERVNLLMATAVSELVVDDVLFIYVHEHETGTEKMENWVSASIINDATNRNRKGLVTIILSEREMKDIKKCGEFTAVYLDTVAEKAKEAVKVQKQNQVKADNSMYA